MIIIIIIIIMIIIITSFPIVGLVSAWKCLE